jgi:hypothetical protein
MNEMQRALRRLLAHMPALLLAGACSGEVAEHDTNPREVARLEQHFAEVRAELLAADVSRLDAGQRARRAQHVARLEEYAAGRVFPHNHDRAERTPFFIDRHGTRCAMAYLIEQSGRGDLVARIARESNEAYIAELAGDPELVAWLDENGLSASEAARIQPEYDQPWVPPPPEEEQDRARYQPSLAVSAVAGAASGTLLVVNLASMEKNKTRGALGAVAGALGATVGFLSMRADEDERGVRRLAAANIGVGLLGVIVGLDVAFSDARAPVADPPSARPATGQGRRVALQPLLGGDSVGLAMGGSF